MTKTPKAAFALASEISQFLADKNSDKFRTADQLVDDFAKMIEWRCLKVGGTAWQREMVSMARSVYIATCHKTSKFIPPSQETLEWGGFMGGDYVPDTKAKDEANKAADSIISAA